MRRAALGVARLARALAPAAQRVWVAAGPGGNGGDGLHAAAELQRAGARVVVSLHAGVDRLPPDAADGLRRAREAGAEVLEHALPAGAFDLAIDALLGLGATRSPEGEIAAAIEAVNACGAPCLAVDLPSGLHAGSGAPLGGPVVAAAATLSLLTLKPGLFTAAGRDHAGEIWFDALDIPPDTGVPSAWLTCEADLRAVQAARRHASHKGSYGDVVVIGGGPGMIGAARLAAHGALAAGAGRTFVSLLDPQARHEDALRPEWLWREGAWQPGRADLEHSTVVCGCGGGDAVRAALPAVLARAARLVLDADALNAVASDPMLRKLFGTRAARAMPSILTPHPLEAARLLEWTTAAVQADRLAAARRLSDGFGAVVVLKGSGSIVAAPAAAPRINGSGSARLASGGSGDVLAGWVGGLWAQQPGSANPLETAAQVAAAAVWLHGQAAESATGQALRALDLVEALRAQAARSAG
jgi:hydroxyethylthiazole kinase-like uncharacterized protein yjeF